MKILVLAPPMGEPGGVQIYTATLLRALRRICGDSSVRLMAVPDTPAPDRKNPGKLPAWAKAIFFLRGVGAAARWRPELCISTHVALAPLGVRIRGLLGGQFWVAAHGIEVWGKLSGWRQRALRAADKVLAVSAFTRQRVMARHGVSASRAVVLPNVLDEELLRTAPDENKLRALNLLNKRVILTVARLSATERYKGHDVVLRALPAVRERVPNAIYLIAGGGDDRGRLENLARELGLGDSVHFLGAMNRAELAACYRSCEVFAMPARTLLEDSAPKGEGFGIAFLEAMAFSRPVIGPRNGAPAEFIQHGQNGFLVNPEAPQETATALIALLSQPDVAATMGERGRQLVQREYSLDAMIRRLEKLLPVAN